MSRSYLHASFSVFFSFTETLSRQRTMSCGKTKKKKLQHSPESTLILFPSCYFGQKTGHGFNEPRQTPIQAARPCRDRASRAATRPRGPMPRRAHNTIHCSVVSGHAIPHVLITREVGKLLGRLRGSHPITFAWAPESREQVGEEQLGGGR
jgi:hypothetical protein